jgi:hypothetical protein
VFVMLVIACQFCLWSSESCWFFRCLVDPFESKAQALRCYGLWHFIVTYFIDVWDAPCMVALSSGFYCTCSCSWLGVIIVLQAYSYWEVYVQLSFELPTLQWSGASSFVTGLNLCGGTAFSMLLISNTFSILLLEAWRSHVEVISSVVLHLQIQLECPLPLN